jgi:BCCT family betaine/carnitine transporter
VALALALFTYNKGLPLTMRSAFYPILGERVWGWWGHIIDTLAVFATLFGLATSLGFGAQQANAGLNFLFGIRTPVHGAGVLIIGDHRGGADLGGARPRWRREGAVRDQHCLAALLLLFVIFVGRRSPSSPSSPARRLRPNLIPLSNPFGREDTNFMQGWTAFYWAWWISWSPFVGMFIARVSRGRTVREFVICVLIIPSSSAFCGWPSSAARRSHQVNGRTCRRTGEGCALELKLFEMLESPAAGRRSPRSSASFW